MILNNISKQQNKRLAIYSHNDINGIISEVVVCNLQFIGKHFDNIIFITNNTVKYDVEKLKREIPEIIKIYILDDLFLKNYYDVINDLTEDYFAKFEDTYFINNSFYILSDIDYIINTVTSSTEKFITLIDFGFELKTDKKTHYFSLDFFSVKDIAFITKFLENDYHSSAWIPEFAKYLYKVLSDDQFKVIFPQNHTKEDSYNHLNNTLYFPLDIISDKFPFIFKDIFHMDNVYTKQDVISYIKTNYSEDMFTIIENELINILSPNDYLLTFNMITVATNAEQSNNLNVALQIHLYYPDFADTILPYLNKLNKDNLTLLISVPDKKVYEIASKKFIEFNTIIKVTTNIGRDITPLLITFGQDLLNFDVVGHIHSKHSNHFVFNQQWLTSLLENTISKSAYNSMLNDFEADESLGIIFPPLHGGLSCIYRDLWAGLEHKLEYFINKELNVKYQYVQDKHFALSPYGSMFWFRPEALKPLINRNFTFEDFISTPKEWFTAQTLAHLIERAFIPIAKSTGYRYKYLLTLNEIKRDYLVNVQVINDPYQNAHNRTLGMVLLDRDKFLSERRMIFSFSLEEIKYKVSSLLRNRKILFYVAKYSYQLLRYSYKIFNRLQGFIIRNLPTRSSRKMKLKYELIHLCASHIFMQDAHKNFNTKFLDKKINDYVDYVYKDNKDEFLISENAKQKNVGVIASELYDVGGHTACILNLTESFYKEYNLFLFLTNKKHSILNTAKKNMKKLKGKMEINGVDYLHKNIDPEEYIIDLYNQIIKSKVETIFMYLHMFDFLSAGVCNLLQKHTNIKIIFCNMADHRKFIGGDSADLIIEGRPIGYKLTNEQRGYHNNVLISLQSKKENETIYYSKEEKDNFKRDNNLTKEFIVFTGCAFDKLFNPDGTTDFFIFVKDLLIKEKNIEYLIVTDLQSITKEHSKLIKRIFIGNEEAYYRLIIIDRINNFDLIFQSSNVFIDSFPQGSALTHIDCMRNKTHTIVKINKKTPIKSFESFFPKNYKYKFETTKEIVNAVRILYENRNNHDTIIDDMYNYYLKRFEFDVVKKDYKEIIELSKKDIPAYIEKFKNNNNIS